MICCPNNSESLSARARATTSPGPPMADGMIKRTGFVGYACGKAAAAVTNSADATMAHARPASVSSIKGTLRDRVRGVDMAGLRESAVNSIVVGGQRAHQLKRARMPVFTLWTLPNDQAFRQGVERGHGSALRRDDGGPAARQVESRSRRPIGHLRGRAAQARARNGLCRAATSRVCERGGGEAPTGDRRADERATAAKTLNRPGSSRAINHRGTERFNSQEPTKSSTNKSTAEAEGNT